MVSASFEQVLQKHSIQTDPLVVEHILKAIQYRIEGNSPELIRNTYLKDLAIPQIVLFDILANQFPIVHAAQSLVNDQIYQMAKCGTVINVLDIGIGRGIQMVRLLTLLNQIHELEQVNVIGIELYEPALNYTETKLHQLNDELRIKINFLPINSAVETTDFKALNLWIEEQQAPLFVNASLCLHHIQKKEERTQFFENIKSLQPRLFTLIEPDANCFTDDFDMRLENAFKHFNALYCYINTLTLKEEEKKGLKQFFSTELFDAIALPDQHRFEKYEEGKSWVNIGLLTGFSLSNFSTTLGGINIPSIDIQTTPEKYIRFGYQETALLSVITLK